MNVSLDSHDAGTTPVRRGFLTRDSEYRTEMERRPRDLIAAFPERGRARRHLAVMFGLGALLLALALAHTATPVSSQHTGVHDLLEVVLLGAPAVGVLAIAARATTAPVDDDLYPTLTYWTVGTAVLLVVVGWLLAAESSVSAASAVTALSTACPSEPSRSGSSVPAPMDWSDIPVSAPPAAPADWSGDVSSGSAVASGPSSPGDSPFARPHTGHSSLLASYGSPHAAQNISPPSATLRR